MIQFYVDETKINYLEAEGLPIALSLQIDDPDNPGAIAGTYSKRNVTVPADKTTIGIFGAWEDGSDSTNEAAHRKAARIEVDGDSVFRGFAQLDEVPAGGDPYRRRANAYKLALIGNNAGWFAKMQSILVRDLVAGYITDQEFTELWAADYLNADPDVDKWGLFLARVKDWSETDGIKYIDHSFFAFIVPLIREAFRLAGYTVVSDFFETDEAKRYIHALPARPFPEDYGRQYVIYIEDELNTSIVTVATPVIMTGEVIYDNANLHYDTGTGFYTVPFAGHYDITYGTASPTYRQWSVGRNSGGSIIPVGVTVTTGLNTERVFLEKGWEVCLVVGENPPDTAGSCIFGIKPSFEFGEGYTIDLSVFCSADWTAADMLLGFGQAFNLQFDTDTDAYKVIAEPADGYISGETWNEGYYQRTRSDLTPKIDLKKTASYKAINSIKEKYRLAWQTDGNDENADDLEQAADLKLYDARYPFPAGRFQEGETPQTVKYFAKTVMYRATEIRHVDSLDVPPVLPLIQPSLLNEKDSSDVIIPVTKAGDTMPRILYFAGRRAGLDGNVTLSGSGDPFDFPAAWFVPYTDATGLQPSLAFSNEPTDIGEPVKGLMARFHLYKLARLQTGRLVEEWVLWRSSDIVNLNFRHRVLINGASYLLKKIDGYIPGKTGSIKTLLEYDAQPETARISDIENPDVRGLVQ